MEFLNPNKHHSVIGTCLSIYMLYFIHIDLILYFQRGNTPLHVAALLGQSEVVKLLLRRGAQVNATAECNDVSNLWFFNLTTAIHINNLQAVNYTYLCPKNKWGSKEPIY